MFYEDICNALAFVFQMIFVHLEGYSATNTKMCALFLNYCDSLVYIILVEQLKIARIQLFTNFKAIFICKEFLFYMESTVLQIY